METFSGIVQKGMKRAVALGFPTLNIPLEGSGASGIYAARVHVGDASYEAAAFADQTRKVLEAHILDADLGLYGKQVSVELLKKIRESIAFEDDDSLRREIKNDIKKVRNYFSLA